MAALGQRSSHAEQASPRPTATQSESVAHDWSKLEASMLRGAAPGKQKSKQHCAPPGPQPSKPGTWHTAPSSHSPPAALQSAGPALGDTAAALSPYCVSTLVTGAWLPEVHAPTTRTSPATATPVRDMNSPPIRLRRRSR